MLAETTLKAVLDVYQVWNDPVQPDGTWARGMPTAAAKLRWPLVRTTARAEHVIEPIAQVIYSDYLGETDVPNEDSQLPEFDETNLFSLNRFPGEDRLETGLRANLGVPYTRYDPAGWSVGATLGRVIRSERQPFFPDGGGIPGRLVGLRRRDLRRLRHRPRRGQPRAVQPRARLPPQRVRARLRQRRAPGCRRPTSTSPRSRATPSSGPSRPRASCRSTPATASTRTGSCAGSGATTSRAGNNLRAGAAIAYGNECAEFDLSISRRYTSSDNVPPSTSIGFSLQLAGIGEEGDREWPPRVCGPQGT